VNEKTLARVEGVYMYIYITSGKRLGLRRSWPP